MLAWACVVSGSVCVQARSPATFYVMSSIAVPILLAYAMWAQRMPTAVDVMAACVGTWVCIGLCMSVCLHRYFAHRAFRTSRVMQFVLGLLACLAFQGDPLWWAVMHRRHHKFCDDDGDPHSSKRMGVWYAVLGWMANPANYHIAAQELLSIGAEVCRPEIHALRVAYPACPLVLCALVARNTGLASAVYWVLVPMWLARFITLLFNHEFHLGKPGDNKCCAENATRLLAIAVGESLHDDHHQHPHRARRPELDPPYHASIRWMQGLGLVWACA